MKNIPELRFSEFKNAPEWEEKKLGEIALFYKGKSISKADIDENGITQCIRYGELYTHYQEKIDTIFSKTNLPISKLFLSCKNDVILPASGETKIDIATASCVMYDDIALGGDINILRSKENGVFLSYYLNNSKKIDIAKIAQGNPVVHLYTSQLKQLDILLPRFSEQKKIVNCLSSIDELIISSTKKMEALKEHKKGLMQQLFPAQDETVPKLRFPEFQNAPKWEEKQLDKIGRPYSGISGKTAEDFGIGESKYITYKNIFDNLKIKTSILENVNIGIEKKQNLVKFGDIFFTISSETRKETGMSSVLLDNVENTYLNSFCFGYRLNNFNILDPFFARFYFRSFQMRDEISRLAQGSTRFNLSKNKVMKIKSKLPLFNEQKKIADCLTSIDELITAQTAKLEALKEHKKGLMQQLFPS